MTSYFIYCDGSYSPKKSTVGIGGGIYENEKLLVEFSHFFTNLNFKKQLVHEFMAINHALSLAKIMNINDLTVFTDSREVLYASKKDIANTSYHNNPYIKRFLKYIEQFDKINFILVKKKDKKEKKFLRADELSKLYRTKHNLPDFDRTDKLILTNINKKEFNKNSNLKCSLINNNQPQINGKTVTWTKFLEVYSQYN